jgi:hypothetical protein
MQKNDFKVKTGKYPFIIHADPLQENKTYPTHTHGLNKKLWPEFMIDPLAFGPYGNADRINEAYDFFKKPRRRLILNRIICGEVIEVPIEKLCKHWGGPPFYTMCFRLVPNTFEAIKLAYGPGGMEVDPDLVVVQIYVKGDDFALMDEYYKGGITW